MANFRECPKGEVRRIYLLGKVGPWPPQAAAEADARLQATCQRQHVLQGPRAHPELARRLLKAQCRSPEKYAHCDRLATVGESDLVLPALLFS